MNHFLGNLGISIIFGYGFFLFLDGEKVVNAYNYSFLFGSFIFLLLMYKELIKKRRIEKDNKERKKKEDELLNLQLEKARKDQN